MKKQPKTINNKKNTYTKNYKSTKKKILLHHILIKLKYLKNNKKTTIYIKNFNHNKNTIQKLTNTYKH